MLFCRSIFKLNYSYDSSWVFTNSVHLDFGSLSHSSHIFPLVISQINGSICVLHLQVSTQMLYEALRLQLGHSKTFGDLSQSYSSIVTAVFCGSLSCQKITFRFTLGKWACWSRFFKIQEPICIWLHSWFIMFCKGVYSLPVDLYPCQALWLNTIWTKRSRENCWTFCTQVCAFLNHVHSKF